MTVMAVFSLEPWDAVWRRNQYLIDGLLRRDSSVRVLFVEPSRDVLYEARNGRGAARGTGIREVSGYDGRLFAFQPTKWLPRALGPLADNLLHHSFQTALRATGMRPSVLWVNDPSWAPLVAKLRTPALYDMTDDWVAADRSLRDHRRIVENEHILMSQCAAVVACSSGLRTSRRGIRPDIELIPNAVDVKRYRSAQARPSDLPDTRVALYVGTLHEDRLDVQLVEQLGRELDAIDATCVLLGPSALSATNQRRLEHAPGVRVLGSRSFAEIPAYLQHADALVVPHVVDEFTDSLDPLKLYEYRVVGRPIIATAVAGFREWGGADGILISERARFAEHVCAVVRSDRPTADVRDVPDWAERVEAYANVIARVTGGSVPSPS